MPTRSCTPEIRFEFLSLGFQKTPPKPQAGATQISTAGRLPSE
jgi:hypothetical protein